MGSPPGHQLADLEVLMPAAVGLPRTGPVAEPAVSLHAAHLMNLMRKCLELYLMEFQLAVRRQLWVSPLSVNASPDRLRLKEAVHRDRPWLPSLQCCRGPCHRCAPCAGLGTLDRC